MRRILILTAGYGEGHNSAARNLCEALNATPGVHATVHDPLLVYGMAYERSKHRFVATVSGAPALWRIAYHAIDRLPLATAALPFLRKLEHHLADTLRGTGADTVVCTHPLFPGILRRIARAGGPRVRVATVVTDSISINRICAGAPSDLWLAADRYSAARLRRLGVSAQKIRTTGFPVAPAFAAPPPERPAPGADGAPARVLLMAGSAARDTVRTARALAGIPGVALTVSVGRDAALAARLASELGDTGHTANVVGWTDRMPDLLRSHHIVLGKAGGATTHETLAARTPFVITRVLPGQEEGNAELIRRLGAGEVAASPENAAAAVERLLRDDAKLWKARVARLERHTRRDGAHRAAAAVLAA